MTYEPTFESGENSEPSFDLEPEKRAAIEHLVERFEKLKLGAKCGIFSGNECIAGNDIDIPTAAASTGKLALACMAIDKMFDMEILLKKDDVITGGSQLDRIAEDRMITVSELIDFLLRESSNTAYSVLGEMMGGPEAINEYYKERKWENAEVDTAKNGKALIGSTTVKEAYAQISSILDDTSGDHLLREAAQEALKNNDVDEHGIRQNVSSTDEFIIYNKTGELGSKVHPKSIRNDVGRVGPKGKEIGYVILVEGPGGLADMAVAEFTAKVAEIAGASPAPHAMGTRAVLLAFGLKGDSRQLHT